MRRTIASTSILLAALWTGCGRPPRHTNEVVARPASAMPLDSNDAAWSRAPEHVAKLLPQDLVEPRLMKPSTDEVIIRALATATEIAFRLQWVDPVPNDTPGPASFLDGCAVQIPSKLDTEPPDPQMGQAGRPVEVTFWRADWQASVNGRPDDIRSLYPNATVDHYPFNAKPLESGSTGQKEFARRYAPADAVGNRRVGPREFPVEDLTAEGPGTVRPLPSSRSRGNGVRTKEGWSVVLVRKLPDGLAPRVRTQVAFAVWEGSRQEVGSRKMRTGWVPLTIEEAR
jgi:ethylbenzene dehydrogenase